MTSIKSASGNGLCYNSNAARNTHNLRAFILTGDKAEILKKTLLFSDLDAEELARLGGLSVERRFSQGEFIFWEGDPSDWLYMIAEGQVKVFKLSPSGMRKPARSRKRPSSSSG